MLAYVVFVVIRHRFWARDKPGEILRAGPTGSESTEIILSEFRLNRPSPYDLIISTSNLRSIVVIAPYLGLAGTCLGILSALSYGVAMERNTVLAWVSSRIAAQLLPTAAGILVAIPAAWSQNYLRGHFERVELIPRGKRFSQSRILPLPRRFSGLPAYPLMAAPSLLILVAVFTIFAHPYTAAGFSVRLNRKRESKPILVAVVNDQTSGAIAVYADSKRFRLDTLSDAIRAKVKMPDTLIDLQADGDVKWADLMNVMDVLMPLKANVVLVKESRTVKHRKNTAHGKLGHPDL